MEDNTPAGPSNRKRSFIEDDESDKAPPQKRVRFPKGKKVKPGEYVVDEEAKPIAKKETRVAAKTRAAQRNRITAEILDDKNRGLCDNIEDAEATYEDDEPLVDDGIVLDRFDLSKEREEGYFDEQDNYVEYVVDEIKDAWLDSIDSVKNFTGKQPIKTDEEDDDVTDLSSHEVAKIKRRIADILQPGETVLLALRRLKGNSNNKKEKMSPETKVLFDQLTEDAMKLMNNGDYDVYYEKQENFQREAEGYEKLAHAREQVISMNSNNGVEKASSSTVLDTEVGPTKVNNDTTNTNNDDDDVDMFAEDEEKETVTTTQDQPSGSNDLQNDYVFDDSTGYYYSSSSGYYYDPSSGLYCFAGSSVWYSYNEESGSYVEVEQAVAAST